MQRSLSITQRAHPIQSLQDLQHRSHFGRGHLQLPGQLMGTRAFCSLTLECMQMTQHLQGQAKVPIGPIGHAQTLPPQLGQARRHHRPQQDHHPGHINPDQQDRHRGKRTVDGGIRRDLGQIQGQQLLGQLNTQGAHQARRQGMPPAHRRIRDIEIHTAQAQGEQHEFETVQQPTQKFRQGIHHVP